MTCGGTAVERDASGSRLHVRMCGPSPRSETALCRRHHAAFALLVAPNWCETRHGSRLAAPVPRTAASSCVRQRLSGACGGEREIVR